MYRLTIGRSARLVPNKVPVDFLHEPVNLASTWHQNRPISEVALVADQTMPGKVEMDFPLLVPIKVPVNFLHLPYDDQQMSPDNMKTANTNLAHILAIFRIF